MEFLFAFLELIVEFALQLVFELVFDFGLPRIPKRRKGNTPNLRPLANGLGAIALGALAGLISFVLFPQLFIRSHTGRILNLFITPALCGVTMVAVGRWLRKRGAKTSHLSYFANGTLFAFSMGVIRLLLSR